MPHATVILINYNGIQDTRNCLKTILNSNYPNFAIKVLDNGSKNNESIQLKKEFDEPRITIERSEKNLGFAGGNNYLIKKTISPYIILLNNDTEVETDWLLELIKTAESDESIAISQSKIRSLSNKEYFEYAGAAGGMIDMLGYPYARGRVGFHLEKDIGQYDQPVELHWASGAAILLKKEVLDEVGLLPEEFFFYHEETDLCWRVRNAGYKIIFAPKSIIYHKGSGSSSNILPKKIFFVHRNNLILLARNLSLKRFIWVLPIRLFLDYLSIIFYLFTGKISFTLAVVKSQISFLKQFPLILKYRKTHPINQEIDKTFKPFSILYDYFILGKKRYSEIGTNQKSDIPVIYHSQVIQKKFSNIIPIILFIFLSLIVVFSWFWQQKNIASGEEGLAFVNAWRTYQLYRQPWYQTGTGYPIPLMIPRAPLFAFTSLFETILPSWLSQAIIFYLFILSGLIGTYLLASNFFKNKLISIFSALFYFFNLFTMTQIFGRLLSNGLSAWAYLPYFLLLWIKIISEKNNKIKYYFLFIISSLIFSNSFGHPAFILTLWIPLLLYVLHQLILNRKNITEVKSIIKHTIFGILAWLISSFWWIIPYLKFGQSAFDLTENPSVNFDSLKGVSQYFTVKDIILLRQSFIFSPQLFDGLYTNQAIYFLSYSVLAIIIIGIFKSIKSQNGRFVVMLFLVSLFLSKGTNPPFGNKFYKILFETLPQTQSLRNSYEKIGILFTLSYALLFGLGFHKIITQIKNLKAKIIITICLSVLFFGILVLPIWKGTLYGGGVQNTRIKIPAYYANLNMYLNNQNDDARILMLPIVPGDGANYNWADGKYNGIDPSEFLFERPVISKILRTKYFDAKYMQLNQAFTSNNSKEFSSLLDQTNVKYFVLRNDIDIPTNDILSPENTKKILNSFPEIIYKQSFDKLDLYEYAKSNPRKIIAISDQTPEVKYIKNSPTRYTIDIKNAKNPYKLVFKETFNDNWIATIDKNIVSNHQLQYNYANAWEIDKLGNYQIKLQFKL